MRIRSSNELVYATVVRIRGGADFAFARIEDCREVFLGLRSARLITMRETNPWFEEMAEPRRPVKGDEIIARIFRGDRGWRAEYWGYAPQERATDAREASSSPSDDRRAVEEFDRFFEQWLGNGTGDRACETFRARVQGSAQERARAARLFECYAEARRRALTRTMTSSPGHARLWTALAAYELVEFWAEKISITIDVAHGRESLRTLIQGWSYPTTHAAECLVREAMELRDAGKPCSAHALLRDAIDRERDAVDTRRGFDRRITWRAQSCRPIDSETRQRLSPLDHLFNLGEDWALHYFSIFLGHRSSEMSKCIWRAITSADTSGDYSRLPELWRELHERDPHFDAHIFVESIVEELLGLGRFTTVRVVRDAIGNDTRYSSILRVIADRLPADEEHERTLARM